jgi:uncharacterized membrane protein HdeD (DUF308 family)
VPTENYLECATLFASRWWAVLLRGLVAIGFGIAAFAWPGVTIATLVTLFAFYAIFDGIFTLFGAIGGGRYREHRWLLALEGVVCIWAGCVMLRAPGVTAVFLVFFISIWAMATGFLRIVEAIRLRKEISGELWLILSGVISILFALMLMARPLVGVISLVWVIASFALLLGIVMVLLSFELRKLRPVGGLTHSTI